MFKKYVCLTMLAVSGCSNTETRLYPIEGPLSQQDPFPTLVVTSTASTAGTNRRLSFTMPDGATCTGTFSQVNPGQPSVAFDSLFSQHGTVSEYSVAVGNVPAASKGRAFAVCSDNTRFDMEYFAGSGVSGYGIAKDTNGNVYRMIF